MVKVIDDHTLVINLGKPDGLTVDDQVLVFAYGDDVVDPETNESFGKLEIIRGRGKVRHVQDRMSTIVPATRSRKALYSPAIPGGEMVMEAPDPFEEPQVGDFVRVL